MAKFRKKPVTVDAVQFTQEMLDCAIAWPRGVFARKTSSIKIPEVPVCYTKEGMLDVSIGDWIISGIKGETYPCKPDIFEATYDAIPDDPMEAPA